MACRCCECRFEVGFADGGECQLWPGLVWWQDVLLRGAVGLREGGAQALVPGDYVSQCQLQCGDVYVTGEAQRYGDVVGGGGAFEVVEEPQAGLCEGQGHGVRPSGWYQGWPGRVGPVQLPGQTGYRRGFEEGAHTELHTEGGAYACYQACGEQGVPAQVEEALVGAGFGQTEYLGEQVAQDLFGGCARPA